MVKKAIIPAAGYGTRSLPVTKVLPKEMFPVGVKPAIHYIVEEAMEAGIEQILMIVSRKKSMIVDYFDHSLELETFLERENKQHLLETNPIPDIQIHYTRQPYAKGLGDAIRLGKTFVGNDPFAVLLPDDIITSNTTPGLKQLIDVYEEKKTSVIGLNKVEEEHLKNYGVVKGIEEKKHLIKIDDVVEKPKTNPPSNLAIIGRYIFTPTIYQYLDQLQPGVGGEYQLTDAIKTMLHDHEVFGKVISGTRYDIGKEEEYIRLLNFIYQQNK
ncbi:UTP--glucose-1-phosphate uridylyltransferase [Metabacillus iocasae]|uniref:UTP--glucose-1-phosphate uridylyltransferase n=1 Tax=Priestia iocasae TaxID=2291674 RepID=A0ABS2QY13_9BACI|nr:UTP--glucose-1-phosphate uridylyltransferase [Metabacillus iocasae]MBM7704383.1 UTP--glucose-1-phosphate uridylyltransferase [Metabacillus iocasae]